MKRFFVLACVVLAACSRSADTNPKDEVTSTTTVTRAELPRPSLPVSFLEPDPTITRQIEGNLATDPYLSMNARNVTVTVDRGIVTLSGTVPTHDALDSAKRVAASVPGVRDVYADVQVSPIRDIDGRESDEKIAFALQRALHSDPEIGPDAERVSIDVVNGAVTLRGVTRDAATKEAISRAILSTHGVSGLINQLRVAPAPGGASPVL